MCVTLKFALFFSELGRSGVRNVEVLDHWMHPKMYSFMVIHQGWKLGWTVVGG